jgi:hypothetical protein
VNLPGVATGWPVRKSLPLSLSNRSVTNLGSRDGGEPVQPALIEAREKAETADALAQVSKTFRQG